MEECLTLKQLERYAAGELPAGDVAALESHLQQCETCREQLAECRANQAYWARARQVLVQPATEPVAETRDTFQSAQREPVSASRPIPKYSITGYEIVRELHRGGQGVVYEAVQLATKRKVAIKILLEGAYASASARKRFEREIELIASLKHPNIIAIYHPGATQEGHPFYVMDYVRGVPLHQYVRDRKLTLKQVLELFVAVCDAVNYAHQRGVIHRDLKPSNILVDASGVPKVLDFGLAKMVGGPDPTLVSQSGQVVGTLPYLSPEQARGNPDEIDTRSDVYALGVILYQVLTGHYPYPVTGQIVDVVQHIMETSPTPLSKAWTPQTGVTTPREGRITSRSGCPINDEVETIVLKALSKEPQRRYQSVGELAKDITHYLVGEPIEAKRDSGLYVLRKMLRRHRVPVTAALVCSLTILAALAYAGVQKVRLAEKHAELQLQQSGEIMARFVSDPVDAVARVNGAEEPVRDHLRELCRRYVASPNFTDRVMGARASLWIQPAAFWESVDGAALWENGEWLEVGRVDWPNREPIVSRIREKAANGTARQQYAAFCLIGQLAPQNNELADLCIRTAEASSHSGVAAAARWAAMRMGRPETATAGTTLVADEISALSFLRLPGITAFRGGSDPKDPDRWPDEASRDRNVSLESFYLATTEVTLASFLPFVEDPASVDLFGPFAPEKRAGNETRELAGIELRKQGRSLSPSDAKSTPATWVSLEAAKRYCEWLTARASRTLTPRRYRLPTEEEWEYACRAGGNGRFCYGNDAGYAGFYASCQADSPSYRTSRKMPNFFGLADMHGGVWEWTDSNYPPQLVKDAAVSTAQAQNLFILKGGAYYSPAIRCRAAQRNYGDPVTPDRYWGFRIVMEPVQR